MITSFGSFAIENNFKELEKSLKESGYSIEDKDLEEKFEELNKLITARENLTEAYEVGLLNVKYLSGESVNNSEYAKAILKIEKGDHDKLIKHYNYNLTKLFKVKNDLAGIINDVKIPSASMENYNSSLQGYYVSVEGIGDVFSKIGEKIKQAWEYIINKMKKFFNWITGKSSEADEASQAASSANIPNEVKGKSGEAADKMKEEKDKAGGNAKPEQKTMDINQFNDAKGKAFSSAFESLGKMGDELTENDIVAIAKPFVELGIGSKLVDSIKKKCIDVKKGVITTGNGTKNTDIKFISKAKVFEFMNNFQNKSNDTRSALQKTTDFVKGAGNTVYSKGKKVVGFIFSLVKGEPSSKGSSGSSETNEVNAKDDSVSSYGYKYHKIDGVDNVNDQRDIIDSCKNYMIKHTSAKTFLAMELIGAGTSPSQVGEADIKNLSSIFADLSKVVNGYADGFKAALGNAINSNIQAEQAKQASTNANNNANNNKQDKKQIVDKAKKNLGLDVKVDENTIKAADGLVRKILDKSTTLDEYIRKLIYSQRYVIVSKDNKIDSSATDANKIFKGFGSQLDKVIVIEHTTKDTNNMTLEDIKPYEVVLQIKDDKKEEVHRTLYTITAEQLVQVTTNLKNNVDKLKNSIKSAQVDFDKTLKNMEKLKNYATGKAGNGVTLNQGTINQISKFLMGGIRLTSIAATAIATRRNNLAKELEVIMGYANHLTKEIDSAIASQQSGEANASFDDLEKALAAVSSENDQNTQNQQ